MEDFRNEINTENSAYKVQNLPSDIAALAEPLASVIHGFNRSSQYIAKILIVAQVP